MKYEVVATSTFKKKLKIIKKRNKDLEKLKKIVDMLSNGEKLEEKYKDHLLVSNAKYKDCRECHIEPDWLLVYRINDKELILLLVETGTHSDLF